MKIQDLLLEMNYIDEKYIEECDAVPEKKKTSFRRVRFALIAAVVTVLLAVTAFAAYELTLTKVGDKSKEYRLVKVHEKYDEIDLSKSGVTYFPEDLTIYDFHIGYIPDGLKISSKVEHKALRTYRYDSPNEEKYMLIQFKGPGGSPIYVDNEHSVLYKIDGEGYIGYLVYDEEDQTGSLIYGDSNITICISGHQSIEELLKIAENITY